MTLPPAFFRGKETTSVSGDIRQSHSGTKFTMGIVAVLKKTQLLTWAMLWNSFPTEKGRCCGCGGLGWDCPWHAGSCQFLALNAAPVLVTTKKCAPALPNPGNRTTRLRTGFYQTLHRGNLASEEGWQVYDAPRHDHNLRFQFLFCNLSISAISL